MNFREANHSTEIFWKIPGAKLNGKKPSGKIIFENLGMYRPEFCLPFAQTVN